MRTLFDGAVFALFDGDRLSFAGRPAGAGLVTADRGRADRVSRTFQSGPLSYKKLSGV